MRQSKRTVGGGPDEKGVGAVREEGEERVGGGVLKGVGNRGKQGK